MCAHSIDAELQKLSTTATIESNSRKKKSEKKEEGSSKPVKQIEELDRKILRSAINRVNEERKNLSLLSKPATTGKKKKRYRGSTNSAKAVGPHSV
jgi:hypothetical protein